ncbi:hypothetical protein DM794_06060 [Paenarthrobacter ureafaciens]|uniref:hypothetical protein n=1 Tax=Paenarthrobacter ureafaciens TaxID=37931 RepID=UPI0015BC8606|nr:hypothetical protein [Paenarthrobacter ureafaciens]NWL26627.1 hypothetical protein [Paenarthrobacter ureafaciens]
MTPDHLKTAQHRAVSAWLGELRERADIVLHEQDPAAAEKWQVLHEGARVLVHRNGRTVSGTVDCVTVDGAIFWIWLDDGAGRTAIYEDPDTYISLQNPTL